ncbi:copper-binding protein [Leisingera aquaemixtae]|uniref:cupredoxin domain-containing protein n=1 Tax=Leisingera aquaemixtae TaxID=1396826 RepID=UPI001C95BD7C|nr:plastocyanin/azurin family copper-binding protein [Leisingera aquaemixtae]MBY6066400.1 copper-binding protein [Leisingera aquaemixtae]
MKRLSILVSALLPLAAAFPVLAEDDGNAAICAEAEERYVSIFGSSSADAEGVTVVKMYKYNFCPAAVTVPVGTTVRWVNVDKRTSHSVLSPAAGMPESDRAFPEESVEFTFLTAGSQEYLCGPHWETQQMIGMVTVTEE